MDIVLVELLWMKQPYALVTILQKMGYANVICISQKVKYKPYSIKGKLLINVQGRKYIGNT